MSKGIKCKKQLCLMSENPSASLLIGRPHSKNCNHHSTNIHQGRWQARHVTGWNLSKTENRRLEQDTDIGADKNLHVTKKITKSEWEKHIIMKARIIVYQLGRKSVQASISH